MVGYGHVAHLINRLNEKNTLSRFIFFIYFITNMRNLLHYHKGPERDPKQDNPMQNTIGKLPGKTVYHNLATEFKTNSLFRFTLNKYRRVKDERCN